MGRIKSLVLIVLGLGLTLQYGFAETNGFSKAQRSHLVRLYADRYPTAFLTKVFDDPRLQRMDVLVKRNIHTKETGRDYANFTSSYSMYLAKKFQRKWRTTLHRASKKFKVDPEVVVAILLVETGFGNVMGNYPVIGVFSSILTEYHENLGQYPVSPDADEETAYFLNRLEKKAIWARGELDALLTLSQNNEHSPYRYMGSYAGAFGLPQFLPSSYLKWGYDSDKNGTVNLFWFPDAIYSTANYLKKHGWKKGLHHKTNKKAVWAYNHSSPYVNAVMDIAKRLKRPGTPKNRIDTVASNTEAIEHLPEPKNKIFTDNL